MEYFLAFVSIAGILCVVGTTATNIMKKRNEKLIEYMKNDTKALREDDCIARNNCADHGEYCRECRYYIKEKYNF